MAGIIIRAVGKIGVSVMMRRHMRHGTKPTGIYNVVRANDGTILGQVKLYRKAGPYKAHFQWTKFPSPQALPVAGDLLQAVSTK